ncbi:hypothetical protein V6N13_121394 [Hibiscus sabdariffa]|uniref:Uncharacterized protein n=1 Tax=Hibiscus sabdariffa TaxID=183260 RepID=A0ABR2PDV8_9ROSI
MDSKRSLKKKVSVLASESSSDSSFRSSPAPNFSRQREEDDAFNAVMMGKESSACFSMGNCSGSLLGEMELMGEGRKKPQNSGMEEKLMEVSAKVRSRIRRGSMKWAAVTKDIVARSRKNKELDLVSGPGVEKLSDKSIYGIAGGDLGQDQHVGIRLMGDGEVDVRRIGVDVEFVFSFVESDASSGGLISVWDKGKFEAVTKTQSNNFRVARRGMAVEMGSGVFLREKMKKLKILPVKLRSVNVMVVILAKFQGSVSSAAVHKGLVVKYIGDACDCLVDAMSA